LDEALGVSTWPGAVESADAVDPCDGFDATATAPETCVVGDESAVLTLRTALASAASEVGDAATGASEVNSLINDSKSSSGVATVRRERTARVVGLVSLAALAGEPMIVSIKVAFEARAETSAPVSLAMA
jgi:hypothetical protein